MPEATSRDESHEDDLAAELDAIGDQQSIPRKADESDADYAERMVYELDVEVENLWAVQDEIRELVKAE